MSLVADSAETVSERHWSNYSMVYLDPKNHYYVVFNQFNFGNVRIKFSATFKKFKRHEHSLPPNEIYTESKLFEKNIPVPYTGASLKNIVCKIDKCQVLQKQINLRTN